MEDPTHLEASWTALEQWSQSATGGPRSLPQAPWLVQAEVSLNSFEDQGPHPHPTAQKGGTHLWPVVGGPARPHQQRSDLNW